MEISRKGGCPLLNAAVDSDNILPPLKARVAEAIETWISTVTRIVYSGIRHKQVNSDAKPEQFAMATTIPVKITEVKKGFIEFRAVANDMHLNPMGGDHESFASTVLDSATGSALHTLLLHGQRYGTVDLHVKMLKLVPQGIELCVRGKVIHLSRRLVVFEAALTDDDGKIYAHATSTCMILRKNNSFQLTQFLQPA